LLYLLAHCFFSACETHNAIALYPEKQLPLAQTHTMQLLLRLFSLSSLSGILSLTLAKNYSLPTHLLSRQSSVFCPVIFVEYPTSLVVKCGVGYIASVCTCCSDGSIGCLSDAQTCSIGAAGHGMSQATQLDGLSVGYIIRLWRS
jgi:hypothetical protein